MPGRYFSLISKVSILARRVIANHRIPLRVISSTLWRASILRDKPERCACSGALSPPVAIVVARRQMRSIMYSRGSGRTKAKTTEASFAESLSETKGKKAA